MLMCTALTSGSLAAKYVLYGSPTFFATLSNKYKAGSLTLAGACMRGIAGEEYEFKFYGKLRKNARV